MQLAIAAGNAFLDITPKSVSTTLTLRNRHGGLWISKRPSVQDDLSSTAKQVFYDFGERPIWAERSYVTTTNFRTATFSGGREGPAIYLDKLECAAQAVREGLGPHRDEPPSYRGVPRGNSAT